MTRSAAVPVVLAAVLCAGCGASDQRTTKARSAAETFLTAVSHQQGAQACDLLAPQTRAEVEQSSKASCAKGLLGEDLPGPGPVRRSEVYGRQAQVVTATDTVFLGRFPAGWRVTAAGCTPRGERPYDCQVKGG